MKNPSILEQESLALPDHKRPQAFWGSACLFAGCISFLGFFFAAILSKLLPPFEINSLLLYYCMLVPLTLPVLVVAVYFHWLSMKLFKHA
ncbi:unnamed protein product [Spirodela intermedia]|uniref:Uncharacterized protein n=1 Tax=Spirodela intermedia TaxID=51605 RepID=A0A7I8IUD3_SPIIN|nr:unnamed protein product [Spirodela intermedia]CAA6660748.1 unnamed protein product [Spirodela intermedia]